MFFLTKICSFSLKHLYSRLVNATATSSGSRMVGPLRNFSSRVSRTNVRMHASMDIWKIKQMEGKIVTKGKILTQTRAVMELARTMGKTAPVAAWMEMISTISIMTRAAAKGCPGLVTRRLTMIFIKAIEYAKRVAWNSKGNGMVAIEYS